MRERLIIKLQVLPHYKEVAFSDNKYYEGVVK